MSENQTEQTQEEIKKADSPWTNIAIGVALIAGALFLYHTFDNFEKQGGSIRLNLLFTLAYKIGGKWTVSVITALIGCSYIYGGVSEIIKKRRN